MVVHACNLSIGEVETEESGVQVILRYTASWRAAWATWENTILRKEGEGEEGKGENKEQKRKKQRKKWGLEK